MLQNSADLTQKLQTTHAQKLRGGGNILYKIHRYSHISLANRYMYTNSRANAKFQKLSKKEEVEGELATIYYDNNAQVLYTTSICWKSESHAKIYKLQKIRGLAFDTKFTTSLTLEMSIWRIIGS